MTRRRLAPLVIGAILVVLVGAACGGGDDSIDTSSGTPATAADPDTTTPPTGAPGSTTPAGIVAPDATGVDLRVVFLHDGSVATGHRRVPPTPAVARAALQQLLAGPDTTEQAAGFTTRLPAGTSLAGLDLANGVATVTLTPAPTEPAAQAQVVYTLTQFPTVQKVRLGTAGAPLTRDDFREVTPLVFLESVAPGDVVTSPVTVAGEANTFEATVRIRVQGADGSVLADTFTTATSGTGTWGTFSEKVGFAKGAHTTGTVSVFWDSPKDGSPRDVVEVPVRFA